MPEPMTLIKQGNISTKEITDAFVAILQALDGLEKVVVHARVRLELDAVEAECLGRPITYRQLA